MKRIYLEYNASTAIASEVVAAMQTYLTERFGNPSSLHWAGAPARAAVEQARAQVARLLGCFAEEIVFTSGGSEAKNPAIKGAFFAPRAGSSRIITTPLRHPPVPQPSRVLET